MIRKQVVVRINPGLEAEQAALFVQNANRFTSEIFIERKNRQVNAKSIMGLLSLGIKTNFNVLVLADGEDEQEAIDVLSSLLEEKAVSIE